LIFSTSISGRKSSEAYFSKLGIHFQTLSFLAGTLEKSNQLDAQASPDSIGRARERLQRDGGIAGVE